MSISVLTTNVFPGRQHIITVIKNLAAQTCKDFEWVFVDAFYEDNRQLVTELTTTCGLRRVVHVPHTTNTQVGRKFDWSGYNQGLLLASEPAFLRLGVFRYAHREVVELAAKLAAKQTWLCLRQREVKDFDPALSDEQLTEKYGLEIRTRRSEDQMVSHCGMFSFSKDKMVEINGNNEALLIHHWEDVDLNCRWVHLGKTRLVVLENAFLRIWHSKSAPRLAKTVCLAPNGRCIFWAKNNHEIERHAPPGAEWLTYRGFRWAKCPDCAAVAVGFCDRYFEYLKSDPRGLLAPIGVGGVGRDIRVLRDDLTKLKSLDSKLELLVSSHTDPRYLRDY